MTLTPRDKRMLQVLGVVAGLALAYFLFTTVLGGDDGGEVAAPTGSTGGVTTPTVSPSVSVSPTPRETLPPVDLAGARDPFSIPPGLSTGTPSGSVAPTDTSTTTPPTSTITPPTSTTTPPTSTTTPPTTTTSPPPTNPPPPPPSDEATIGGHDLRLDSIAANGEKLQIEVDGKLWTVEE
ncbi:MAG: hypothetical protein ACRDHU_08170, partial [Actinomycetota bacterium]